MATIYQTLPDEVQEVDVIIAGGGTAACVVAARLADADPETSILVIEQGPNNFDVPTIVHPALFLSGLMPTSNATLFYQGNNESQLNDRQLIVPSGGTLGGGSSINLMMYSRAQRVDFDSWDTPGGTMVEMIPYLKKVKLDDNPNFNTGFFSDAHGVDIKKHIWAYKKQREIFRRMKTYRGELPGGHPTFPTHSSAVYVPPNNDSTEDISDILYSAEDDKIIEEWVRGHVETTWHSMGTCKMAPREEGGVMDRRLNVYGVERLKVVDLSIPPQNVAANTMNTAVAIAEKGADMIIDDLRLGCA